MPLLDVVAPADFSELSVRQHMDITKATESVLDVAEWASGATGPMKMMNLGERMWQCEEFLLTGIIEPMVSASPSS